MSLVLVSAPNTVRRGETFGVKSLISHRMETGFRPGPDGQIVPRDIIRRFTCTYGGVDVVNLTLSPAIAANPFVAVMVRAVESGPIVLRWTGDNDFVAEKTVTITVTS